MVRRLTQPENFEKDDLSVTRSAAEAEPLRLVFVGVWVKSEELRDLRIDVSERMRKRERSGSS